MVFIIDDLRGGGAARVATGIARSWCERGWQVSIVTVCDDGDSRPAYDLHPAIRWCALSLRSRSGNTFLGAWRNMNRLKRVRRVIADLQPTVVVAFLDRTNVLGGMAAWSLGVPFIVSERTDPHCRQLPWAWEFLRILTYQWATAVVVQTKSALGYFPGFITSRAFIIPNPAWTPARREPDHTASAPAPRIVVGIGSLRRIKGFDRLIAAFSAIASQHPEWRLQIWGEGPERDRLQQQIDQAGLASRIILCGTTRDVEGVLAGAQLFALSSRGEGFPNVLLEAMASGLPVVSFACASGPSEIVRHEVDGLLVPDSDVPALAAAMGRLMSSTALRSSLGTRATEVVERFPPARIIEQWANRVLESSAARRVSMVQALASTVRAARWSLFPGSRHTHEVTL